MKRIVSLLLVLVMLRGLLPQRVMATETPDTVAGNLCDHQHDDSCYIVKCTHIHGECGYTEDNPEVSCNHDCAQDTACNEKILNCTHVHDDSCGYVETNEDTDSDIEAAPDEEIGSGTPDGKPPVLHGMIFSSTTVNAPGAVEFSINASDDVSGLDYAELSFSCQETGKKIKCGAEAEYYDKEQGKMIPYDDGLLHGVLEFDSYVETGIFTVDYIYLRDVAGNYISYYPEMDNPGTNQASMPSEISKMAITVLRSETPDSKPPVLNQIFFYPETVESLEEIEIVIDATDDVSGVQSAEIILTCVETGHSKKFGIGAFYYDEELDQNVAYEDGMLHGTFQINEYMPAGKYVVEHISLNDNAQNRVGYSRTDDPQMPDQVKNAALTILETGKSDNTPPVLNGVTLSATSVTAPGQIQVTMDAFDDLSGIASASIHLYCKETEKFISANIVSGVSGWYDYEDGLLHGTLEIDQYVETGNFVINTIWLTDKEGNRCCYSQGNNGSPSLIPDDASASVLPESVSALTVHVFNTTPDVTTSVSKSDFVDIVENAANDAYIAADYSGDATMSKEAFEAIAGTDKTIDLISEGITWRFEGSDITEEIKDIDLKVEIQKVEEDPSASGDAIEGSLNGNPGVVMKFPENGTLPGKATIQVKVDYAMREYLGSDQGLCVYYYNNQTGELELIASDLKVINDTYVEFPITHCSYYVLAPMLNSGSTSSNSGTCGANLTWEFDEITKVLTISGTGPMQDFTLDGNWYGAKATDTPWLNIQSSVLEVVIENGVTTVGRGAFAGMEQLIVVSLPDTLTSIGDFAFHNNLSLKALKIPDGVTSLGEYSLCCCPNLVSVTLPEGITKISTSLFDQTWPDRITIPAAVTTVGSKAFAYGSIGEIVFTGNAPTFAEDAFHGLTATVRYPKNDATWANIVTQNYGGNITWVADDATLSTPYIGIPTYTTASGTWGSNLSWTLENNGVLTISGSGAMMHYDDDPYWEEIGKYAWRDYADGITKLVVEEGITELNRAAFSGMKYLTTVILPNSLMNISTYVFADCVSLQSITLGSGVTEIGDGVFARCTTLEEIIIPSNVKRIGEQSFDGCKKLKNVSISEGVTVIWKQAFRKCTSLTSIDFPESLESIGVSAFESCTGLTEVTLPKNLLTLYGHVFYNCSNLKTLYFEGNAVDFHPYALLNLTATAYYPGNNPTWTAAVRTNYGGNITWAATAISGKCGENLTWTFSGDTLTISGTGDMYDYSQDQTNSAPWTSFSDDIKKLVIEEGTTGIGDYAFADCSAIENASFPSTLTRVGEYPFNRFSRPNGNVYYRVFWSEVNQTVRQWSQIQFEADSERFLGGDSTDFIEHAPIIESGKYGDRVYWEMNENGTIEFFGHGNMEEFWATGSWLYDLSAKTIVITEGITNIGMNAFESYGEDPLSVSLETVKIASTVTRVEEMAFAGCQALKTITFTGDAPSFGDYCFRDVTATAYYPAGNETWTAAVMQDYDGNITWVPYCLEHSFGEWITEGTNSHRTCIHCGYTEHKVVTDSGNVEIEIPDQPELDVEVDPVLPSEDNYVLVEEALDSTGNQNQAILKVFDINLKNSDGVHVQPSGTVKVKLPLDWSKNGNYKVYRVNDDGTLTDMNAYRQGSHMVFETDHFSLYVIVEEGHRHSYQSVVTASTCTEDGFTTYTCAGCGNSYVDDGVAALGHSYDNGKVTTKPTCMTEGVKTYTCGTCGDIKTEPMEKDPKNHSFTKYESDKNATCKKNGTKTAKCDYGCGKTDTVTDRGSKLGHKYQGDKCIRCGVTRWNPDTGDKIMIAVATMSVSAVALLVLFVWKKRK